MFHRVSCCITLVGLVALMSSAAAASKSVLPQEKKPVAKNDGINTQAAQVPVWLQNSTPGTAQAGHFNVTGTGIAGFFSGNGSLLTSLNASNISLGTLADGRLSANVALLSGAQTFTGVKTFSVAPSFSAATPFTVSGTGLVTNLNADLLDSQSGAFYQNASNLNAGTLSDSRLSSNVALLNNAQTFTGAKTFSAATTFSNNINLNNGRIIYNAGANALITAGLDNTNAKRMLIAHSESFPSYGIQYRDTASDGYVADCVEMVGGSQTLPRVQFELGTGDVNFYDTNGNLEMEWDSAGVGTAGELSLYGPNGTTKTVRLVAAETSTSGAELYLTKFDGTASITLDADYNGNGRVITQELQITGGSDLSEHFDVVSKNTKVEAGMVVCLDPSDPGKLVVSGKPYDRTVAGIISGAGGVKPGMLMGQTGTVADGQYPVALTGRVYCWCDASNGPIMAGDLLTTSSTPGHAMKVTDHGRAQGAIIGKAMSSLKSGKGLVLVLAGLQ